ncbi:hypothetical protein EEB14_24950 [Rhodococcus sp. WS4]|nr:hypothetical protein EEB14_24950 [Rhodococcus sp. WS4]
MVEVPRAILRFNYRLARIPLQLIDDLAVSELDEQAPTRLAYEQFLITCDRTAAYPLSEEHAAARAADLRRHTASARVMMAREQHRNQHRGVILLDRQRARFNHPRPRARATDPA